MSTAEERPPASLDPASSNWDLGYLRVGALLTGAAAAVAVPLVGLLADARQAWGVALGLAVVVAFFALSGVVVAWAGRIHDSWTLPAALLTFGVKALLLFALVATLPNDGPIAPRAFAWAVVAGVLGWQVIHGRWVWTRKVLYVNPAVVNPALDPARVRPQQD